MLGQTSGALFGTGYKVGLAFIPECLKFDIYRQRRLLLLFSSLPFIFIFFPAVLLIYFVILRGRASRNIFLSIASLIFYAWGEPWFVLVMLASIAMNYMFGIFIEKYREDKKRARTTITFMLIFNIGMIFVFKYLQFVLTQIDVLFSLDMQIPVIRLPIGISFFTFQAISYVIDVYRGDGKAQRNIMNVCLYISFFPQLIAGPIVRYQTVAREILHRKENWKDFTEGFSRFVVGLGKKVLLSNAFGLIVGKAFATEAIPELSVSFAWLGACCCALQIFFDFSGYSDMAIGLGRMFGFHFLENFNYPFISRNLKELWQRWHISLGSWFRDYLYIPLGGNRVGKFRMIINLLLLWLTTGLWHGADWTFVAWGLWFFIFISIEKYCHIDGFMMRHGWLGRIYTLLIFVLGLGVFQPINIMDSFAYLGSMFGLNGNVFIDDTFLFYVKQNIVVLILGIIFSMPVAPKVNQLLEDYPRAKKVFSIGYPVALFIIFLVSVSFMVKGVYNPFIYFNF